MNSKYDILLNILDQIREESRNTKWEKQYAVDSIDSNEISYARSKSYIHLYLKVMFGIENFLDREPFITDGSYDGGIDGYYIDKENKRIYLIQSKFRNNEKNFENTPIKFEELVAMQIDKIISGSDIDPQGNKYNGKIVGLMRSISELPDVARYNYHVVIIANSDISPEGIRRLTDGYKADLFDFNKCYNDLVFPILNGTFFKASDITLQIDLSNKNAGAKTSYSVLTPKYDCEVTVLFVPTIEIAKAMDKYRNSILEYNPRSYLDLDGQNVNNSIRETLTKKDSNEFALMNNGLTILSDETHLNEKIGQHNKAQIMLLNPQIINGGQTAYTLSRIYNEHKDTPDEIFYGKEVLVKVITLTPRDKTDNNGEEKIRLIDEISAATNRQTAVISTDRFSMEAIHIKLQKILFDRYGYLYERKRGEFSDGILLGYISKSQILERNLFIRIFLVVSGKIARASRRKVFAIHGLSNEQLLDEQTLDKFCEAYELFKTIAPRNTNNAKKYRDVLVKVYLGIFLGTTNCQSSDEKIIAINSYWDDLVVEVSKTRRKYFTRGLDRSSGQAIELFSIDKWMNSADFEEDVKKFTIKKLSMNAPIEKDSLN